MKVILHGTLLGSTLFAKVPVHGFLVYKKVNGAAFSFKVSLQMPKIEKRMHHCRFDISSF